MGTGWLLVPKSNVIPGNPRLSALRRGRTRPRGFRYLEPKRRLSRTIAIPHRTQEAAGSSPASSTLEVPRRSTASTKRGALLAEVVIHADLVHRRSGRERRRPWLIGVRAGSRVRLGRPAGSP